MGGTRITALALALAFSFPTLAATEPQGLPAGIAAVKHGHGWQFANAKGMTIYTFDRDEEQPGASACKGECLTTWPPVAAEPDAQPHGPWSLIARDGGSKQWAYKGKPLYTYASDAFPGSVFGDGVNTVWWVAFQPIATPAEVTLAKTLRGDVLADAKGMTLYTSDADKAGKSSCNGACSKAWSPVLAPWLANPAEDFTIVVRDDGTKQWAYKDKPLYRSSADVNPGETAGDASAKGWHATVLEPPQPMPAFITVQPSDAGELLAEEHGLTIYAHGVDRRLRRFFNPTCEGECIDPDWHPLIAAKDAKPLGNWALVDVAAKADALEGVKQWSFKGQKLYTHALDKKPGDFKGIRFGGDRTWAAISGRCTRTPCCPKSRPGW